jgi:hypothetical protein
MTISADPYRWNNQELLVLQQIGAFVFWFSQLELALRTNLADALHLPAPLYDAVTASYDFRTLCAVTREVTIFRAGDDKQTTAAIEQLINKCLTLNDLRVKIAHGTWMPGTPAPTAMHMSRQTLQSRHIFEDPQELLDAVISCRNLCQEAFYFQGRYPGVRQNLMVRISSPRSSSLCGMSHTFLIGDLG